MADQNNAPERIWLQEAIGPEHDRTWCAEQQDDDDTLYIRADLARADRAAPKGQVRGANRSDGGFSDPAPPPAAPTDNTALVEALVQVRAKGVRIEREANAFQDVGASLEAKIRIKVCDEIAALASREAPPASQQEAMPVGCGQPCGYDCNGACFDPHASQQKAATEALSDLLQAVCGETGFAAAVRRESGKAYPWPALDLAEAKALRTLKRGSDNG